MADKLRLTLAQLNPALGDFSGNLAKARDAWAKAKAVNSDMLVLPEMFLSGYQAQDLVQKPAFTADALVKLQAFAAKCHDGPAIGIGLPMREGAHVYNCYAILKRGKIANIIRKHHLPNYKVFDEPRTFHNGEISGPYSIGPARIGSPICEDAWFEDVCETLQETGAEILVSPNASPYYRGKFEKRINTMVARVIETGLPMVYLNLIGGQDDQVFDGGSFVLNPGGELAVQLPLFDEAIAHVDFTRIDDGWRAAHGTKAHFPDAWEQDYHVMVTALRDYMDKTGFKKVLLGLSGGIDSAIVATIAVDALGAENVRCVMLPSEYTSRESLDDAAALVTALGCKYHTVPISAGRDAITNTLAPMFEGLDADVTEENIQSRLRGLLLMAMSNKFGEMLLTTGNKSEVAVGYATIYGDMAGGYNPIKDVYKMRVFETCRWRNAHYCAWMMGPKGTVIPENIINKPPTAELRDDQKDSDSLPEYDVLDGILEMLMDQDASVADCVAAGYDRAVVKRVENLLYISEYKRFQSAPGARLSLKAFWLDRRYPIANKWRDEG
ncbi:MAG: NAD+ synthase [Rhodobacterales bacterium]